MDYVLGVNLDIINDSLFPLGGLWIRGHSWHNQRFIGSLGVAPTPPDPPGPGLPGAAAPPDPPRTDYRLGDFMEISVLPGSACGTAPPLSGEYTL